MQKTATMENITQIHLAQLVQMAKLLIEKGQMSRKEAEITLRRIASENELSPIYF